jgi:ankyrin repeat protein
LPTIIDERSKMNRIDRELIVAAIEDNLPEVRRLLSVGADVHALDDNLATPLHWASCYEHVQVIQALMEHGADMEAETAEGDTPLHVACLHDRLVVVIELLYPGAEIDVNNDSNHG